MGNLVPASTFDDVPYFEADAVVSGGPDCPDNIPIQALLNRTQWLNANKQAAHALLTALAGLAAGANKLPYFTGASSMGVATISAFILTLLDDANATAALATLGAAPLASPALTGTPTAPTAAAGTNTTQLATTAFVQAAVAALIASSPAALDTLNELAAALGNDANFATTMTNALAGKAPLASPALTGTPTGPTAAVGTSTTQLATTAFVNNELGDAGLGGIAKSNGLFDLNNAVTGTFIGVNGTESDAATYNWPTTGIAGANPVWWNVATYGSTSRIFQMATQAFGGANFQNRTFIRAKHDTVWSAWKEWCFLDSPIFTGTPTAPTAATGTNTTQLATTAYVVARIVQDIAGKANLASPALTGTPTAPTAAAGTNTTQIATTAFVQAAVAALIASSPAALDTLNELAAALGNDANFATTMTNALAGKQSSAATLTALAALTTAANQMIYSTGADAFAMTPLSAFMRTLLDDTDAATALGTLGAASSSSAFGLSQTAQNVTASRALSTNYTNTTGRPIFVNVISSVLAAGATLNITVGGVLHYGTSCYDVSPVHGSSAFAIVPPGATYSAACSVGGNGPLIAWTELR